jgi:hypothetical protein
MPYDDELRRVVIREAFQQCCKDGQVGDMVLACLRDAAPSDLYDELVIKAAQLGSTDGVSPRRVTTSMLPADWSRSVVRARTGSTWRPATSKPPKAPDRKRFRP